MFSLIRLVAVEETTAFIANKWDKHPKGTVVIIMNSIFKCYIPAAHFVKINTDRAALMCRGTDNQCAVVLFPQTTECIVLKCMILFFLELVSCKSWLNNLPCNHRVGRQCNNSEVKYGVLCC